MEVLNIKQIKFNDKNPRTITPTQLKKLKKSITEFPEMLQLRPLVVDENNMVLGGNMRLKALTELGIEDVPVQRVETLSEEKKKEFIIKDNVGYGDWDWDVLTNDWDLAELSDWGLEPLEFTEPKKTEESDLYTKKIQAPIYNPSENKPAFRETYDDTKYLELVRSIESSDADPEIKDYLKLCAVRHIVFDYSKIADLYAHSDTTTQNLMEEAALVIIDYDRAVELGYVKLGDKLMEQYLSEHYDEE